MSKYSLSTLGKGAYVDSNRQRSEGGYDRCYELFGRSSSRVLNRHRSNHLQRISISSDSCNVNLVEACCLGREG